MDARILEGWRAATYLEEPVQVDVGRVRIETTPKVIDRVLNRSIFCDEVEQPVVVRDYWMR
jgi:hypothetical protein